MQSQFFTVSLLISALVLGTIAIESSNRNNIERDDCKACTDAFAVIRNGLETAAGISVMTPKILTNAFCNGVAVAAQIAGIEKPFNKELCKEVYNKSPEQMCQLMDICVKDD
ncbi:uncharacterized protein LOC142348783 [Convolutriloba macropyga]|uniref:uncharacterized protein LOC142348783 n=1 Tax=Convolutriloba macropyga TaxID=536237 RepID=UPI003F5230BF